MLQFDCVKLYNFGPYKKAIVPLAGQGFTLILGEIYGEEGSDSNGSGKTMGFESLPWGLFDKTTKGFSHDEVIRDGSKKGCRVDILGRLDGQKLKIRRTRKHPKYGTDLRLFIGGIDESKSTVRETQKHIIEMLGYSYETFINSTYFPQETATFFSTVTDKKRKELLEKILGLEAFSRAKEAARADVRKYQAELQTLSGQLIVKQNSLTDAEETQERLRGMHEGWDAEHAEVIQGHKRAIRELKRKIRETEREIERGRMLRPSITSVRELRTKLSRLTNEKQDLIGKRAAKATERSMWETKKRSYENDLDNIRGAGAVCEACGSEVTPETEARVRKNLDGLIETCETKIEDFSRQVTRVERKMTRKDSEIETVSGELDNAERHTREADQRDIEIEGLRVEVRMNKEQLGEKQNLLATAEEETSPFEIMIGNQRKKEKKLKKEIKKLKKKERIRTRKLRRAEFWEYGFGDQGLKNVLLETALAFLENQINEILARATQGSMSVTIRGKKKLKTKRAGKIPVRKKIDFVIDRNGKRRTYNQLSTGQRKRVNIASLIALRRLSFLGSGRPTNILILDELLTNLDASGVELVMEILENETTDSTFLISHRGLNSASFDSVWTAVMRNDITNLEIA